MKEKKRTPREDAERLASLCRLALSDEEKAGLSADLADMIAFADALLVLDTDGVYNGENRDRAQSVMRKDTVSPSLEREKLLSACPCVKDGYIAVPRILGEETGNA